MQNYQQSGNYGYGYPQEPNSINNNNNTKPFQSSSSVQFFDPNGKSNSNNLYQGPQNLGYTNSQSVGYGQNPNYGYSSTPLNTGFSLINANIGTNNLQQNAGYSSNSQRFGYDGGYSQNISQQKYYQSKQNTSNFPIGSSQVLFTNAAIVSKAAKKTMDVCQDKDALGMLIIYDDYKQANQRFNVIKDGDSVNIVSVKSGKYLTVGSNSDRNGAPVFQEPVNGLIGQKFRLSSLGGNQYLIHTFCGKVLDCCQESTSNGTRVIQWDCDRKVHQMWTLITNA